VYPAILPLTNKRLNLKNKRGLLMRRSDQCTTSNHEDVEHIWSKYGLSMDQFRKAVKAVMADYIGALVKRFESGTKGSLVCCHSSGVRLGAIE